MNANRIHCVWVATILTALSTVGCDSSTGSAGSDMDALANQMQQNSKAAADAAAAEQARATAAQAAAEKAAAEKAAAEKAAADKLAAEQAAKAQDETTITITVKNPQGLLKGMDGREGGRTTAGSATVGEGGGYLSAIAAAHRHITTRVDDLAWTQAARSYWAETGHYPKSHEEFMKNVIEAYGIELPPLEENEEYLYDPTEGDFGTLYVVTKAPPQQQQQQQETPPIEN